MTRGYLLIVFLSLALPSAAQEAAISGGDAEAGATVFKKCAGCHAIGPGAQNKTGPRLNGVIGRVAGSLPDYKYSPAMVEAGQNGLTWTEQSLAEFLANPRKLVPGTTMSFPGLKDPTQLGDLIAFLATHQADK
jgi:cytochrome c2